MDVADLAQKAKDDAKKKVLIYNPLSVDFYWWYDGKPQTPLISKENIQLSTPMANHVGKLLVNAYLNLKKGEIDRERAERMVFP